MKVLRLCLLGLGGASVWASRDHVLAHYHSVLSAYEGNPMYPVEKHMMVAEMELMMEEEEEAVRARLVSTVWRGVQDQTGTWNIVESMGAIYSRYDALLAALVDPHSQLLPDCSREYTLTTAPTEESHINDYKLFFSKVMEGLQCLHKGLFFPGLTQILHCRFMERYGVPPPASYAYEGALQGLKRALHTWKDLEKEHNEWALADITLSTFSYEKAWLEAMHFTRRLTEWAEGLVYKLSSVVALLDTWKADLTHILSPTDALLASHRLSRWGLFGDPVHGVTWRLPFEEWVPSPPRTRKRGCTHIHPLTGDCVLGPGRIDLILPTGLYLLRPEIPQWVFSHNSTHLSVDAIPAEDRSKLWLPLTLSSSKAPNYHCHFSVRIPNGAWGSIVDGRVQIPHRFTHPCQGEADQLSLTETSLSGVYACTLDRARKSDGGDAHSWELLVTCPVGPPPPLSKRTNDCQTRAGVMWETEIRFEEGMPFPS